MTASLALYRFGTRLLEPLAPWLIEQRIKKGKENPDRIGERFGVSPTERPKGTLLWLHAASVGETQSVLTLVRVLLTRHPELHVLITTGTVTSAVAAGVRVTVTVVVLASPSETD